MSTGSIPTDDRTTGAVRARHDGHGDAPSLVAELVFRELIEAETGLTEDELRERTLLPGGEVREAISELDTRGLCATEWGHGDDERRRYVASFPAGSGV